MVRYKVVARMRRDMGLEESFMLKAVHEKKAVERKKMKKRKGRRVKEKVGKKKGASRGKR